MFVPVFATNVGACQQLLDQAGKTCTNIQAYLDSSSVTTKKLLSMFKIISLSLTESSQARVFVPDKPFQSRLIFASQGVSLPANIRPGWQNLLDTNTLAFL